MITTRFFSLFLILSNCLVGQNLVPNPSFEEYENGCPFDLNEPPLNWNWWTESPNSFNTCVEPQNLLDSLGWAPWNGFGYQLPYEGESYVGLYAFGPQSHSRNYREYIGCELTESLEVGQTYYVSFQTSLAFGNYFYPTLAGNKLGVLFTTMNYDYESNPLSIPNFAHVYEENVITDTTNWVIVSGSFVPDQPYSHMGIGVFFDFALLDTIQIVSGPSAGSYYYIDNVCVSRFPECDLSTRLPQSKDIELKLYPNPASNQVKVVTTAPILSLLILNMQGLEITQIKSPGVSEVQFSIEDLPAGTYLVELRFENKTKREKLVVVR